MISKIRPLKESEAEDAARLFADVGRYYPYFQRVFGVTDCVNEIYKMFREDIGYVVSEGKCIGMYDKGVLVGAILSFEWSEFQKNHPEAFAHMFHNGEDNNDKVFEFFETLDKPLYYVLAILVRDGYRCQGHGTHLVTKYTKMVGNNYNLCTDQLLDYADTMWLSNGYVLTMLDKDLKVMTRMR